MTAGVRAHKGAPLIMLALVLGCWIGLRSFTWAAAGLPLERTVGEAAPSSAVLAEWAQTSTPQPDAADPHAWTARRGAEAIPSLRVSRDSRPADRGEPSASPKDVQPTSFALQQPDWLPAAPPANTAQPAGDALPALVSSTFRQQRLSLDAWLFLREGGADGPTAPLRPATLAGSQAGAIIRYDLRPGSPVRVDAYLRASTAFGEQNESEAAAGLAVRPVREVPVALHAEARVTYRNGDQEVRPAIFAIAGVEREESGFRARGYAQAGYVGGAFGTGFVDGQLVVEKRIADTGPVRLGLGAGTWGGAQKGAARLDLGPTISAELHAAGAPVRVEASYRKQIAGRAQPDSGFALTVSTGF